MAGLAAAGALDYAGGTVVHINAGVAGLVACLMLGKRIGYGKEAMAPHNLILAMVGACFLWIGWFGFNGGSGLAADGRAVMAIVVSQIAAAARSADLDGLRICRKQAIHSAGRYFRCSCRFGCDYSGIRLC